MISPPLPQDVRKFRMDFAQFLQYRSHVQDLNPVLPGEDHQLIHVVAEALDLGNHIVQPLVVDDLFACGGTDDLVGDAHLSLCSFPADQLVCFVGTPEVQSFCLYALLLLSLGLKWVRGEGPRWGPPRADRADRRDLPAFAFWRGGVAVQPNAMLAFVASNKEDRHHRATVLP